MTRASSARAAFGRLSVFLFALAAACGGSATPRATPACISPSASVGPDATATLGDEDAGKTFCVHDGDVLTVFLHAPPNQERWSRIDVAGDDILEARSTGVMTLVRGVTGGIFGVHGSGTAELRSTRRACPACAEQTWSARVVVR